MLVSLAPGSKTIRWNSIEALFTNVFNTTGKHVLNTAEVEYYGALLLAGEIKNRTSGKGYQLSPNEMLAFCGLASNDEGSSTSDTTLPDTSTADKDQGIPGTYKRPLEDAQREQDSVITKKTKGDSHLADRYLADQRSDASMHGEADDAILPGKADIVQEEEVATRRVLKRAQEEAITIDSSPQTSQSMDEDDTQPLLGRGYSFRPRQDERAESSTRPEFDLRLKNVRQYARKNKESGLEKSGRKRDLVNRCSFFSLRILSSFQCPSS